MKFLKSRGDYFYKVYKNGKKKRISKDEYYKFKQSKNMVKKGGGRTLECCTSEPQYVKFEVKFKNSETHQRIYEILMTIHLDKHDNIEKLNSTQLEEYYMYGIVELNPFKTNNSKYNERIKWILTNFKNSLKK